MKHLNESQYAANIETTDENLNAINGIFQQKKLPSLGKIIFATNVMHGPTAAVFACIANDHNGITIKRNEVVVNDFDYSNPIKTGITREAVDDMVKQYDKGIELVVNYLHGLANEYENKEVIKFLKSNAVQKDSITLDITNPEDVVQKLSLKLHSLILEMNSKNVRTYQAFVVVPKKVAATLMSMFVGLDNGTQARISDLFIGSTGLINWYVNPVLDDGDEVYLGLQDSEGIGKNAAYFSEYIKDVTIAVDYESANSCLFIRDRFALTMSPAHSEDNPMLVKFTIA